MPSDLAIQVECYAGYRADEHPIRFALGERCVEISEIVDQWQGIDYRYFKVKGKDGGVYILRHDEKINRWELTMFDAGNRHNVNSEPVD